MLLPVKTPEELGLLVRAARKADKLRMDDVAGAAGVGPVFLREVERRRDANYNHSYLTLSIRHGQSGSL